jgi:hypothetical protein
MEGSKMVTGIVVGGAVLTGACLAVGFDSARWCMGKLRKVWEHTFGVTKDANGIVVERGIFRYIFDTLKSRIDTAIMKVVRKYAVQPTRTLIEKIRTKVCQAYIQVAYKLNPMQYAAWLRSTA